MDANTKPVILCATDFSETSRLALDEAIRLAKLFGVDSMRLLSVGPPVERLVPDTSMGARFAEEMMKLEEVEAAATRKLAEAVTRDTGVNVVADYRVGRAADEIAHHAAEIHANYVVVGTHGRTGLKRALLGSVAEEVVRRAPCTVVAVRARATGG